LSAAPAPSSAGQTSDVGSISASASDSPNVIAMTAKQPPVIPVNAPMCDKCGKMFLDCKCGQIHEI
jgi:hypothetical protein